MMPLKPPDHRLQITFTADIRFGASAAVIFPVRSGNRRDRRHGLFPEFLSDPLIVLAVIVGAAILAPVIAPYDPNDIAGPFAEGPSKEFWLGTDQIGRACLSPAASFAPTPAMLLYYYFNFTSATLSVLFLFTRILSIPTLGTQGGAADVAKHMVMPVTVLAFSMAGSNIRYIRSAMLEILQQDYFSF